MIEFDLDEKVFILLFVSWSLPWTAPSSLAGRGRARVNGKWAVSLGGANLGSPAHGQII
jgi:hypothetical protein